MNKTILWNMGHSYLVRATSGYGPNGLKITVSRGLFVICATSGLAVQKENNHHSAPLLRCRRIWTWLCTDHSNQFIASTMPQNVKNKVNILMKMKDQEKVEKKI